jgi:hypothetical protein
MIRSVITSSFALFGLAMLVGQGCKQGGIGDPCIPEQEYDPTFSGFSFKEVNVESKSFQCVTRVCLVNHFRGRVSCPKGQNEQGSGGDGAGCKVPGTDAKVFGPVEDATQDNAQPANPTRGKCVAPQCNERKAADTVYCSCRCADAQGRTDNGNYCTCPDAFKCEALVASTGSGNEGLTGSYCIKVGTAYDQNKTTCNDHLDKSYASTCD